MKKNRTMVVVFLAPALIFFCAVFVYPILRTLAKPILDTNYQLASPSPLPARWAEDVTCPEMTVPQIEEIIEESGAQMRTLSAGNPDEEVAAEEQILLAEYALDFAHRAADRALLLSMEAIDTQLIQQKEGEVL